MTTIGQMAIAGALALLASAGGAWAQQARDPAIPNLVGTWTASTRAVLQGSNPHRPSDAKGPVFPSSDLNFRYVVKEQPDSRFAGEMTSGGFTETFVGDLAPPHYRNGAMAGRDGIFQFTVRDADTLDVCYTQFGPENKIVDCFTLLRQK